MSLPALFTADQLYTIGGIIAGLALLVVVYVRASHFGLSLRGIRADRISAAMAGVDVVRTRTVAWLISAALAGLAGGVWAIMTAAFYAETPFDLTISVYAIVFALFGGVRTVLGPLFGTVVLYSLYQYIGISNPQDFELVYGLLIIVLVLFLPGGLTSLVKIATRRLARARRLQPRAREGRAVQVSGGGSAGEEESGGNRWTECQRASPPWDQAKETARRRRWLRPCPCEPWRRASGAFAPSPVSTSTCGPARRSGSLGRTAPARRR
jgi:hypothetical protein